MIGDMKRLFIYGASGAGKEIYDMVQRINREKKRYDEVIFIDDFQEEMEFYGTKRIHFSSCEKFMDGGETEFVIAVGEPSARSLLLDRVLNAGYKLATIIDNSAIVSDMSVIKEGCVVEAGAIISSSVTLERNVYIKYQAVIGHDAHVGENCIICPRATVGGGSNVGQNTFLGLASSMKEHVNIGSEAIVGLGSIVFKDVPDGATVVGNPARITLGNKDHKVF